MDQNNNQSRAGNQGTTFAFETQTEQTSRHLSSLLTTVRELYPLTIKANENYLQDKDSPPELDGGVMIAGQAAMVSTLQRLERIINDDSRWDTSQISGRDQSVNELIESQKAMVKSQHSVQIRANRPSSILKPKIGINAQGIWMAMHETPGVQLEPIVGLGTTPEQAMDNFDRVFRGFDVQFGGELMGLLEAAGALHPAAPPEEEPKPPAKPKPRRPRKGGKDTK